MKVGPFLHTQSDGTTWWRGRRVDSAVIGKGGIRTNKREGDEATPVGEFSLRTLYYRPDRVAHPATRLPAVKITADMGWCDDPHHHLYNQLVKLPIDASHEKMWRESSVYDMVISTSHNQNPIVPGNGSAIFIHLRGDNPYTDGCLAMNMEALLAVIADACPDDVWRVDAPKEGLSSN